jgi:hypothetical protein
VKYFYHTIKIYVSHPKIKPLKINNNYIYTNTHNSSGPIKKMLPGIIPRDIYKLKITEWLVYREKGNTEPETCFFGHTQDWIAACWLFTSSGS